ncbi:uncharacterized protein YbjT (DUF2867 family) [Kribbella amoyensis]|uniref:Uncharacterized protein YbjT (DUF2867 family) n=1 Tax=Kribbella amoyensis TaxID=996641 RepID=A0A561BYK1_9ACTN|nr:NAD(P)H-binding protein [Kribbella amoyensis]TWD83908.1 uncharacterized protein YbjT (DUF2867 family) [Kribbella amoyensis]
MRTILVTGGTGTLGRPTVERLRSAGHDVRVLSRRGGPGLVTGDLGTGVGLAPAVDGADVVVHLATSRRSADAEQTKTLLRALESAGTPHLVLISIVGIEQVPMAYYRAKVEAERLVQASAVPSTILRATQFHNLVDEVFTAQRFLPVLLAPAGKLQPIAVEDVAERLTELASGDPADRVADIGGPEQRSAVELAHAWKEARGSRRPVVPLRLPGKAFRAYSAGALLADGAPYGRTTFADYLRLAVRS